MSEAQRYLDNRDRLIDANAYEADSERDACGVGLIADINATPRREVVELAIKALKAVWHRGAVDADGKTGDGAGLRVGIPQDFFKAQVARTGHAPGSGVIGVGMIFLPRTDFAAQERSRTIVETEVLRAGLRLYGWRQAPIDPSCLGDKAASTRPAIEQILFEDPKKARGFRAGARALSGAPPDRGARARGRPAGLLCRLAVSARCSLQGHVPGRGYRHLLS